MLTETLNRQDAGRSLALGAAAAAQVLVPLVGPLLASDGENAKRYDTVITPPDYAFSIWGPIFASCTANAVQHALSSHTGSPTNRCSGWPLAGAYATNALWSLAAQGDQFRFTPAILPMTVGFAATAYRRLQHVAPTGLQQLAPASTGLLLGWTSLAAAVNLATGAKIIGAKQTSRTTIIASTTGVACVALAISATVLRSRRGFIPLGSATMWGVTTTALMPSRPTIVRIGAGIGSVVVAGSTVVQMGRMSKTEGIDR